MRAFLRTMAVAALGLTLGGCLSLGSISHRGTAIDQSIGTLANRTILINLARASRDEPLYFVTIGNVQGTGTTDLKLTNPTAIEGPGMLHIDTLKQLTFTGGSDLLDNSAQTNVTMSLDATKDFYSGIMSPLTLNDVDLLLHQGFPRELVYFLVIDHAKFTNVDNKDQSFVVYNDPSMPGPLLPIGPGVKPTYAQFLAVMQLAMSTGFVTEVTPAPDCSDPEHAPRACKGSDKGEEILGSVPPAKDGKTIQFVLQQAEKKGGPAVRLCFEREMASPDVTSPLPTGAQLLAMADAEIKAEVASGKLTPDEAAKRRPIYCGREGERGGGQVVYLPGVGFYTIEIYTRSIYGMFEYLGRVMDAPREETPTLVDYDVLGERTTPGPILNVTSGQGVGDCFAATRYAGSNYCVPNGPEGRTSRELFNILSALIALKQSPGDLPVSSTVFVAP